MLAHAKSIKERVPGSAVVFIGPCISKKDEAEQYGQVDLSLIHIFLDAQAVPHRNRLPLGKDSGARICLLYTS